MTLKELDGDFPIDIVIPMILKTLKNAFIYGYRVRFIHALAYQLATFRFKSPTTNQLKGIRVLLIDVLTKVFKSAKMGINHGKTLAGFAIVFRSTLALLNTIPNRIKSPSVKLENNYISGAVGGVLVYSGLVNKLISRSSKSKSQLIRTIGDALQFNESILSQITMYTLSRLILAIGRDFSYEVADVINKYQLSNPTKHESHPQTLVDPQNVRDIGWMVTCGLVWGGIMMYYRRDGDRKESNKTYLQKALRISLEFIYGETPHAWKDAFDYGAR